uniref:Uncharacterized protein n=1 Tax=viral metagenome TaxID=1070528 RepID=A0A6M3LUB9_9ZZZZ
MAGPSLGEKVKATFIAVITTPFTVMTRTFFSLLENFFELIAGRIDRDMQVGSLPAEGWMLRDIEKVGALKTFWREGKNTGTFVRPIFTGIMTLMYISQSLALLMEVVRPDAQREAYRDWLPRYPYFRDIMPAKFRGDLGEKDMKTLAGWWGFSGNWYDLTEKAMKPIPGPGDLREASFRGLIGPEDAEARLRKHGFYPSEAELIRKSWTRYPEYQFLRDLSLRGIFTDAETTRALRAAGYTDGDAKKLQELFFYIPAAPDLIRMAVREAFTPEIAERFGQYEDFPPDFAKWAAKQGISAFWAKAFWAAHWDLPSVSAGYEMLHRDVIKMSDLEMLLRAQDVMPFWRDKLIKISYKPYTRVDVRRMHKIGVLDDAGVKRGYLDLGYDDEKATEMTKFTIAYNTETDRELTKTDILDGFKRKLITETEALDMLTTLGYDKEEAAFYIQREKQKLAEIKKKAVISAVKTRFERGLIDEAEATQRLLAENVTQSEIDELLDLWVRTRGELVYTPPVGKLETFFYEGIISADTFSEEMVKKGCAQKHIDWYIESIEKRGK